MGLVCTTCRQGWQPGHRCDFSNPKVAQDVDDFWIGLVAGVRIAGRHDPAPSFAELLPARDRPKPWRPE